MSQHTLTWYSLGVEQLELIDYLDTLEGEPCEQCIGRRPDGCMNCLGSGVQPISPETKAAIENQLAVYRQNEVAKVDPTAALIRELTVRADVDAAEGRRLIARAARWTARLERVKQLVLEFMQLTDKKKLEGQHSTFSRRGNGGVQALEITQPELIPKSLQRVSITLSRNEWEVIINIAARQGVLLSAKALIVQEPDNAAIRKVLETPCPTCFDIPDAPECPECGGSKRKGVPGARLLPRGEQVRLS